MSRAARRWHSLPARLAGRVVHSTASGRPAASEARREAIPSWLADILRQRLGPPGRPGVTWWMVDDDCAALPTGAAVILHRGAALILAPTALGSDIPIAIVDHDHLTVARVANAGEAMARLAALRGEPP